MYVYPTIEKEAYFADHGMYIGDLQEQVDTFTRGHGAFGFAFLFDYANSVPQGGYTAIVARQDCVQFPVERPGKADEVVVRASLETQQFLWHVMREQQASKETWDFQQIVTEGSDPQGYQIKQSARALWRQRYAYDTQTEKGIDASSACFMDSCGRLVAKTARIEMRDYTTSMVTTLGSIGNQPAFAKTAVGCAVSGPYVKLSQAVGRETAQRLVTASQPDSFINFDEFATQVGEQYPGEDVRSLLSSLWFDRAHSKLTGDIQRSLGFHDYPILDDFVNLCGAIDRIQQTHR